MQMVVKYAITIVFMQIKSCSSPVTPTKKNGLKPKVLGHLFCMTGMSQFYGESPKGRNCRRTR